MLTDSLDKDKDIDFCFGLLTHPQLIECTGVPCAAKDGPSVHFFIAVLFRYNTFTFKATLLLLAPPKTAISQYKYVAFLIFCLTCENTRQDVLRKKEMLHFKINS